MLCHMYETGRMLEQVHFLYGTKLTQERSTPSDVLFLPRLMTVAGYYSRQVKLDFFFTSDATQPNGGNLWTESSAQSVHQNIPQHHRRRITEEDLLRAIGSVEERRSTVCYVCGPPRMTDEIVQFLQFQEGMAVNRVLCEKWW